MNLTNNVDFLLITENKKTVRLKNNEWNGFKFGVYLLGEYTKLTVDCNKKSNKKELGHLKIRTSHLWMKSVTSTIDCSGLGFPSDSGPGMGGKARKPFCSGGGAGHGQRGSEENMVQGNGAGGPVYGEKMLLKQLLCGSGGGFGFDGANGNIRYGGSGGGVIEIVVEQHLLNYGTIKANGSHGTGGWGGGGSGGSILIHLRPRPTTSPHVLGNITCKGGNQLYSNKGGDGRIAIYGATFLPEETQKIKPRPFNSVQ
ncbi:hypothetical protein RFI_17453 [Reticulomyxa filosa]|uniref:Uncharacterized protein n=1 Tax=Reticulomyxa filosa TaxID=46433 RepID=X6N390_RETFI|nr:hypothetical protein RFI_17453 [Reticulomyxa filosa]|eukprot:ETO19777.1 hypothetical protein RFI_17453 [Reticulomyxa filosa]